MTEEMKNALRWAASNSPIYVAYGKSADRDSIRNEINAIAIERQNRVRIMKGARRNTFIVMFTGLTERY